ncbi:outer membrane protein beta-barrel family-domain-containing protein [Russula earlei]|uniref:Outer membrane protein beta-barrel family-domain-containing protein n=1 Tax=Russula earlei TaxID=71964 RepID=A0ACC0TS26_9AGAM|nr:outer membrane protein beta-barrel family-domain-containing protein [Russula earlei]
MGGALTTTLNYTKVTDIIEDVIQQNPASNETFLTKSNIAQLDQFGISINAYLPLKKWWTFNLYSNVYNNRFRGTINGTYVDIAGTTFVGNVTSSFKFNKGWGLEVSGFYRSGGIDGVVVSQPMGAINFGASKTVLKGKGTIRLNYRDPFHLQYFRGATKYGNVDASLHQPLG